jgi:putative addiction module CopG family antidote
MKSKPRKAAASEAVALNASLPRELRSWVDQRVTHGGFGTPSEYVRSLIREDRERSAREERLEREVLRSVRGRSAQADAGAGLREALDMLRMTLDLMRGNLRRDYPKASEAEIERRLEEWKKADVSAHEVPGYIVRSEKHLRRYLSAEP